ncbi:PREDICTED: protein ASPARTIC PROTEASE IN GUARD CELL 1-like [Tarenaya hassleriana]|uniref:protein ASPARTIC PROTEASE IN GUARD CELL 1-like n=1 Tax=Tarenaya hassleriana TaxID=28532 RepID=UPI00053C65BE|nr:PREDICTED: protein ASPARTIC PROTEASE IN GUARD CELL 1-like [Tarenaya hassleriana]
MPETMASAPYFSGLPVTLSLLFLLFVTTTFSRSLTSSSETTILDVVSSLQQTHQILSLDPSGTTLTSRPDLKSKPVFLNSSSFSLELHSRETLVESQHKDYRSLLLGRLERDSARVSGITAKVRLAIEGVERSKLHPVHDDDSLIRPEDMSTPVVSGASQGSGEYFSRVGVGTPPKEMFMVLDTGSDVNWIQCQPCSDCYQQSDPVFNPASSSSYSSLSCASPQCSALEVSACRADKCLYQVSYGDGSFTVGEFATETVSFGNSGKVNGVALGCGHDNEGLFVGSAGLLGLGGGALSLTSQIKAKSFSYCLVDRNSGGSSSLDFNSARLGSEVTAPLLHNHKIDTFYYVGLTGFSVGGHPVAIPPSVFAVGDSGNGGVIVDCGTAVTRLQTQAYNSLRDAFARLTANLKSASSSISLFDTCYDFSSLSTVRVPTVALHFAGGKSLELPAKNYLIPVDSAGIFCFAFAPTSTPLSIIGNVQQQGTRIRFDLANNLVGFLPNKC